MAKRTRVELVEDWLEKQRAKASHCPRCGIWPHLDVRTFSGQVTRYCVG